ncbi:MAG: isoleucine--tRNA ligase [Spirochaetes bacterium]|jgi:isoleucyl-tRNA synthetase|nr:isoleucine--tRNA ligase [Spirochaetota bacterium]
MDYSKTVNLPTTDFPMRANLPKREPEMLVQWSKENIYPTLLAAREGKPLYILHDGPPYANGNIHLGHALNKILKDIIVKHKTMMGFKAPYVPGWDCHGLPIELQVTRELGDRAASMPKHEIRKRCREYAAKYITIQMEEFKRLGVFGDYENPYLTMSAEYEARILEIFGDLYREGFITRGKKPIYWCPTCVTALAEAEVEYHDHSSPSIFVKFPVDPASVDIPGVDANRLFVLIWTTTPWTLPANLGVCFHPDFPYSAYRSGEEYYIMADGLAESVTPITGIDKDQAVPVTRAQIERLSVRHPFIDRESKVLFASFVTLDQGSGIVHIAPGHGMEDYLLGIESGLDVYCPVDDHGRFTDEFPEMKGVNVFDANPMVIELLKKKGVFVHTSEIEHSYPHCWRCKEPLIFRATEQWFFMVDHRGLRKTALKATDDTIWIPAWGESRFRGMIENRPDWCLSRQRSWGVPIPSFRCAKCRANLMNAESIHYFAKLSIEKSIDAWYTLDIGELIPPGTKCSCGGTEFEKEYDILDVWFDSGVSHYAVLDRWRDHRWPSDLYLEGSDQHRGWFQSSLWPAIALRGRAPYGTVLTHGFILDEQGKAMSKSMGNVIPPSKLIEKFGADILRLWVSSEDYRNDVSIGYDMMNQIADSYRKIRNTFKFIIGNLSDFDPARALPYAELLDIDKWILHELYELSRQVIEHYEKFEFHLVYRKILNFCAVELSSLYFDISKDILYIEAVDSVPRRSCQTALYQLSQALTRLAAPVLSFTAEEVWRFSGRTDSVHAQEYHRLDEVLHNPAIAEKMDALIDIKKDVLKSLETKRKEKIIGTSLEADIDLYIAGDKTRRMIAEMGDEARRFFQVAEVTVRDEKTAGMEDFDVSSIRVARSAGSKCVRCWNYSLRLGTDGAHPELCPRCTAIILKLGNNA